MGPDHSMAKISKRIAKVILETYSKLECSKFVSKIINMYSKLGGSYTNPVVKDSAHGNVFIFPLCSNIKVKGKNLRNVAGVLVRARHHVVQPSDKVIFITIKLLNVSNENELFWEHNIWSVDVIQYNENVYLLRQNSINRADITYLTFINNAWFNCTNIIGEISLK